MARLLSLERYVPPFRYDQEVVTRWVRKWLLAPPETDGAGLAPPEAEGAGPARPEAVARTSTRLLSVYASAGVKTRASVVPIEEVFRPGDFETQNRKYAEVARCAGIEVARRALKAARLGPGDVDFVVSVSCTGFMIPPVDAYVADALGLGPRLARLPITEAGCAGGVVGLARAADYLAARPDRAALVLALELSSLTFQRWDRSAANVVSTAIFGDGGAAAVLVGPSHPRAADAVARIGDTESVFYRGTTHLMGFDLRNAGLQIVLDKGLAPFVRREVLPAVDGFLAARGLTRADICRWILHPGGRRVIEVMAEQLGLASADRIPTQAVLSEHGNMSSATVLFVLDEILRRHRPAKGARGLLGAFGPGFSAELALVEFL
jgi:alkylresorcinol/alkylpyrone synthase